MRKFFFAFTIFLTTAISAQKNSVSIKNGMKLPVNGNDFFINGMNRDYFPIDTKYGLFQSGCKGAAHEGSKGHGE